MEGKAHMATSQSGRIGLFFFAWRPANGVNLGTTWGRPGHDLGTTWVRPGYDLLRCWDRIRNVHPGHDNGTFWPSAKFDYYPQNMFCLLEKAGQRPA